MVIKKQNQFPVPAGITEDLTLRETSICDPQPGQPNYAQQKELNDALAARDKANCSHHDWEMRKAFCDEAQDNAVKILYIIAKNHVTQPYKDKVKCKVISEVFHILNEYMKGQMKNG